MTDIPGLQAKATAASLEPVVPFWSIVVGAGRANEGLRANWQRQLKQASSACGFKYVRFHGLYHDDMAVYREVDGVVTYNFQYIDDLFDAILDIGVRPFVEFGFCPSELATVIGTVFWWKGNGSPPKDFAKWGDLITATVQHWIDRYGYGEVVTWYFECWNEPNLQAFFQGSRSQYYTLYEVTAKAVKGVNKNLRVGGPSTSNFVPDSRFDGDVEDESAHSLLAKTEDIDTLDWQPVWVKHFLTWCHSRSLPVDFVSCHPYPTDWALDGTGESVKRVRNLEATPKDLALIRKIVSESPYPLAEIHLTEWSSSPSSRDHAHDYVPAAVYIARTMIASIGKVDTIAYWTFTDVFEEEGAGPIPFHGGFGMINLQGLPKPTFHSFRLLKELGDELLYRDINHGVVTRHSKTGLISALLYHYPPEMKTSPPPAYGNPAVAEGSLNIGSPTQKRIGIADLVPRATFRVEILAPGHRGDVVSMWKKLGSPATINRKVAELLDDYSSHLDTTIVTADDEGKLVFEQELEPWTLIAMVQIKS